MPARARTSDDAAAEPHPSRGAGLGKPLLAFGLLSLLVYIAVMTLFKMSNNDIWIHLKTGELILKQGWVPIKDPYSFVASDRNYVAHEWLAGVIFYLVYSVGGVTGLTYFKASVLAAACGFMYKTARLLGARLSVILPAFGCTLYIATARYLERPHIWSYMMAPLYMWLFFRYREGGRDRRWLYALLPLHVVWTNLHGGFVIGVALVATFALGEALAYARTRWLGIGADKAPSASDVRLLGLLVPGCIAASFINPYGYRALTFPFEVFSLKIYMDTIYEWQPPYHPSYNTSTMFFFFLVQVGVLCAAFFRLHRDRTRSRDGAEPLAVLNLVLLAALAVIYLLLAVFWVEKPAMHWTYDNLRSLLWALLGLFSLFTVLNLRSVDFTQAGIFALYFLMCLQHNRAVTDAAMGTLAIVAASASGLLEGRLRRALPEKRTGPKRAAARAAVEPDAAPTKTPRAPLPGTVDRSRPPAVVLGSVVLLVVSAHAAAFTYYFDFAGSGREKGFGVASNMPVCAVNFIEKNRITGNAFVSYSLAAMLIHRMHPLVKVSMDSRDDVVYGEELYKQYVDALRTPGAMREYLRRYRVDFFLLNYGERVPATFDYLDSTGEWAPVYYDDRTFVLLRRTPETEDRIRRLAFKSVRPAVAGPITLDASNAAAVLEDAERAIENCKASTFGYYYKTKALLFLGRGEEALATARQVLSIDPRSVIAYSDMAAAHAFMGQRDKAIEMYERALAINPGFPAARDGLRRLRGF